LLRLNPWDVAILTRMATACSKILGQEGVSAAVTYGDCELYYLKCAFDTAPRDQPDPEVCRQLAEALEKRERFVDAVRFWDRLSPLESKIHSPKIHSPRKNAMGLISRLWTGIVGSVAGVALATVAQIVGQMTVRLPIVYLERLVLCLGTVGLVIGFVVGNRKIEAPKDKTR
jgi:hypothetical protein